MVVYVLFVCLFFLFCGVGGWRWNLRTENLSILQNRRKERKIKAWHLENVVLLKPLT